MIISSTVFILIAVVIGIALLGGIYALLTKVKLNESASAIGAFVVAIGVVVTLFMMSKNLYVVTGESDASHYRALGSPDFTTADGKTVSLTAATNGMLIINETEKPLILERVVYGSDNDSDAEDYQMVMPKDFLAPQSDVGIDHYFADEPPSSVRTKSSSEVRYWLRFMSADEMMQIMEAASEESSDELIEEEASEGDAEGSATE